MVAHFRPAQVGGRWVTPMEGDAGFPDLVLAQDTDVVLAELKSEYGRVSVEQARWIAASGAYLWRPSDRAEMEARLASEVKE